jgi:hypothetical protein
MGMAVYIVVLGPVELMKIAARCRDKHAAVSTLEQGRVGGWRCGEGKKIPGDVLHVTQTRTRPAGLGSVLAVSTNPCLVRN